MQRPKSLKPKAIIILAASLAVASASAADAWVNVTHRRAPQQALAVDSDDPVALVSQAQTDLSVGKLDASEVEAIANRSVAQLPINAAAFRLFGLVSSADSDIETIRRRMALSDRFSRRDIGAQLWLIEDAVVRDNIGDALYHYDTALRVRQGTRDILYPILAEALKEPAIRARFVPYMTADNPWLESFLRYAVSSTDDPRAIADLADRSGGFPKGSAFANLDTQLLRILVQEGYFEDAVAHFVRISEGDRSLLASLALNENSTSEALAPISWQPFAIEGIEPIAIGTGGDKVEIESRLEAGYVGPFVRKMLALRAGRYAAQFRFRTEDFTPKDSIGLTLVCAGAVEETVLFTASRTPSEKLQERQVFSVPADCPVQMLTVAVRSGFSGGTKTLTLADANLRRVSAVSDAR